MNRRWDLPAGLLVGLTAGVLFMIALNPHAWQPHSPALLGTWNSGDRFISFNRDGTYLGGARRSDGPQCIAKGRWKLVRRNVIEVTGSFFEGVTFTVPVLVSWDTSDDRRALVLSTRIDNEEPDIDVSAFYLRE